jgi:hypothetical protein
MHDLPFYKQVSRYIGADTKLWATATEKNKLKEIKC